MSATSGDGVALLLQAVADRLRARTSVIELVVPYERGDVLAAVHREGEVLVETAGEGAMRMRVRFDDAARTRFQEFVQA
jgi:GTP-binding protein HflX